MHGASLMVSGFVAHMQHADVMPVCTAHLRRAWGTCAGKPPSAFRQDRLRLDFRSSVAVGERLGAVLDGLLVRPSWLSSPATHSGAAIKA